MKIRIAGCLVVLILLFCFLPSSLWAAESNESIPLPRIAFFVKEGNQWKEQDGTCFLLPGESIAVSCCYLPLEGTAVPLEINSSNPEAASVKNGILTAGQKEGQTTLTAVYKNIKFTQRITVNYHAEEADHLQCDGLEIDREKGIVYLPEAGYTVASLKQMFRGLEELVFYGPSGSRLNVGGIGTGCMIQLVNRGVVKDQLTFFLYGDLDGNGKINRSDTDLLTQVLLRKSSLSSLQQKAADCNQDGQVDSVDLYKIALLILESGQS